MTCIAYKDGAMAADTLICVAGATRLYGPKLYRLPDGSIFGAAGGAARVTAIVEWLKSERKGKSPRWGDLYALHLTAEGLFLYASSEHAIELDRGHVAAVGSGMDAALGILRTGGSLEQAVKAAMLVDNSCGGEVDVLKL